ncbi:hypothetical protein TNCV_2953861 [Trichonephila clavipes]|nr:hypothetical protein TNCV_2953861 [Trichonephila clavipes]
MKITPLNVLRIDADKNLASVRCAFCLQNVPVRSSKASVVVGRRENMAHSVTKQGIQQLETRPGCEETQEESIRTGPESVVANGAALARERCRNCGGGDRGRVAIYRPFGELRRAKIVRSPVWCSRPTTGVPLAHATMNFVGLDLTASDRYIIPYDYMAAVAEWSRYRSVAGLLASSSPVRVGERCMLNLSRARTSSSCYGVVVRRRGASSGVDPVT